jgi:peptidoglycan hydrolase-like protein with peptidoglycan-binding domain
MPISDTRGVLCGLAGFVTQSWGKGYMMQVLEAHGKAPRHRQTWFLILGAVVLVVAAAAVAYGIGKSSHGSNNGGGTTTTVKTVATPLAVSSTTPASGTTTAASNSTISITFSSAITLGATTPTLSPPVAGTWVQASPTTIRDDLAAPLIPASSEVVTIPGGTTGIKARGGGLLPAGTSFSFTVADGSVLRLRELLAQLNFLPVSFAPSSTVPPAAKDMAEPVLGTFAWRWPNMPAELTTQWTQGLETVITKAAVEMFENQNGLTVDGLAGPQVWTTLLRAVAADKVDTDPYTYVLVSKVLPENLTLYDNGVAQYTNIPVNTGAPGADTVDGTYPVFEHVTSSEMKGTNPDGTTYDDPNVPWASYFNGGDALHGFVRAQYGFPQSNGCVEMTVADAGMLWPLTPIGTLVTVVGPAS